MSTDRVHDRILDLLNDNKVVEAEELLFELSKDFPQDVSRFVDYVNRVKHINNKVKVPVIYIKVFNVLDIMDKITQHDWEIILEKLTASINWWRVTPYRDIHYLEYETSDEVSAALEQVNIELIRRGCEIGEVVYLTI
jgi:hypothetical protein